ncbi:MAG: prepilin-type N-terminal cleavage/methylation domain-containing protein [Nitrospira sp.]|nr:prepilin-type N-terminal cleavage/methylation domain-containing protein [Nitrospira sp.]
MLTSSTRKYNTRGRNSAFTLIELVIVIFIISLTTALIIPNFWDNGETALKSEAKRIANTLRYIYDEAAGKKLTYTLKININESSWGFESENESRLFEMKEDIVFRDIMIPSLGNITTGEAILLFGPLGPEEPVTLHLSNNKFEYTVIFNHLNGRAKVYEGYRT